MRHSCGGRTEVVDTRLSGSAVRRRRVCVACKARFSTLETVMESAASAPPTVVQAEPPVQPASKRKRYWRDHDDFAAWAIDEAGVDVWKDTDE